MLGGEQADWLDGGIGASDMPLDPRADDLQRAGFAVARIANGVVKEGS